MRRFSRALVSMAIVAIAASAEAHHPATGAPIPHSRLALELDMGEVEAGGGGLWRVAMLTAEQALFDRMSVSVEVPFGWASFPGGEDEVGPGDISLAFDVLAWRSADERWALTAGTSFELPTGDFERNLGGGHYMVAPRVAITAFPVEHGYLGMRVTGELAVADAPAHAHSHAPSTPESEAQHAGHDHGPAPSQPQSPVNARAVTPLHGAPWHLHSDYELRVELYGGYRLGPLELLALPSVSFALADDDWLGQVMLEGGVRVWPTERWNAGFRGGAPVAGQERERWHGTLAFEHRF